MHPSAASCAASATPPVSSARTTSAIATKHCPPSTASMSSSETSHLNAEEEPELPDYPTDPAFKAQWGPRGVLKCKATDKDDATVDPRFGRVGRQTIEDTG